MTKIAKKSNPKLWARAKQAACSQAGLCKHSARKMQWATRYYKKHGGKYAGAKSGSNSMRKWTREKWGYVSKGDAKKPKRDRGRYLPERVRKRMTKSQKATENRKKREATRSGKAKAKYTDSTRKKF